MHPTGFEPVMFIKKADYESDAFDHSATNASLEFGTDGTWTHVHIKLYKINNHWIRIIMKIFINLCRKEFFSVLMYSFKDLIKVFNLTEFIFMIKLTFNMI